ncbi:MAG: hypothetical protein U0Y10_19395 [Spirosomataceae bacterium]
MESSTFRCDLFFTITGRGLVVTGEIIEGNVKAGDWFMLNETLNHRQICKRIIGIGFTKSNKIGTIGLMLETKDNLEMEELKSFTIENELAKILLTQQSPGSED